MEKGSTSILKNESKVFVGVVVISIAVPVLVAILLFMPSKIEGLGSWVYFLPHLNAIINTAATLALIAGLIFIKQGKIVQHRASMTVAIGLGAIFLVSYVIYHASAPSTTYGGEGMVRSIYYFFLISHILLAIVALFPILLAYYYGFTGKYVKHKKMVRFAYPIWLYVTVTGVIVYLMISPYYQF
ncbi:DUF420 domain-containing protein [Pararhodonellum marinum]|uniref:DUF420 domain-containing protein n=1 Tax=Pararhodonellum marinum TaxID=2755358 RepID=UPI00188EBD41|nr:DUF420 domain-containing protein [Pararhodonellum marinum]